MRPEAALDIECFQNWFLIGITDAQTGQEWDFQLFPWTRLDIASIEALLRYFTIVTFNGDNYDLPMLLLALQGATCEQLKIANDEIIPAKGSGIAPLRKWPFFKKYGCYPPDWLDHIDISEPTPGVKISLKQYMCRMHSELIQDSPVDFKKPIDYKHVEQEIKYCRNDRKGTQELRTTIAPRMDMRFNLSERYGVDLRSKSDAQMAEAMMKVEWAKRLRAEIENGTPSITDYKVGWNNTLEPIIPKFPHGHQFKAVIPAHIYFVTPYMQSVLELIRRCDFTLTDKDEAAVLKGMGDDGEDEEELGPDGRKLRTGVVMPKELLGLDVVMEGCPSIFRMGIGGLHSKEKKTTRRSVPGVGTLVTADVAAYYPQNIVNSDQFPSQLGPLFKAIYREFKEYRDKAKIELPTLIEGSAIWFEVSTTTAGFKVVNVGTFGKLFSRHSIFYAPQMGISVTVGGQLLVLMLIERLTLSGIKVVSANTDGIEMFVPSGYESIARSIMQWWEKTCNLTLETHNYLALCSRDVNNYVSLQFDGTVKRKGIFGRSGVISKDAPAGKHPDMDICAEAVIAWLTKRIPISQTVRACTDIRKFIRVRGAKGGARMSEDLPDMNYGRSVRWYYSTLTTGQWIIDATSGNKVAGSDGAMLCMRLPTAMPADVDFAYYEAHAEKMLLDMGVGG